MKILVTGGAGYVGSTLIRQLLEQGHHVRVMDNLMCGGDQILPYFRNDRFDFQKGDIRSLEEVKTAVKGMDVIVHLAAIAGYAACRVQPHLAEDTNVNGTKNIIMASSDDQLILFASTESIYENTEGVCTEETPQNSLSIYGKTKALAEKMLLEERNTIAYRFAAGFGISPCLRFDSMINEFAYRAVTQRYLVVYEKELLRPFIHVHDMGCAFLFGLENIDKMEKSVFNVGAKAMLYSKEEICKMINKQIDIYVHYVDSTEETKTRYSSKVSYNKIHTLGYQTTIGIEDGIKELLFALPAVDIKTPYSNI